MVNRELKKALLEKLGITSQALSQQAKKIKEQYAMTTEDAVYVIAQKEKIILDKYLDKASIDRVRVLMQHISYSPKPKTQHSTAESNSSKSEERKVLLPSEFEIDDPLLSRTKKQEAKAMASLFPLLYVLENSIRNLIDNWMTSKYGKNWWDTKAPRKLRDKVDERRTDDTKYSWHQRRGSRPIDYLDMNELPKLVNALDQEFVPDFFSSVRWFEQFIEEVYKSRCVICHMNPLNKDNEQALRLKCKQWQKQIKAKIGLIPK